MKKHLYEIKRLDIPAYLKWWFIKYRNAGTLSEVLENLTSPITLQNSLRRKFKIFEIEGNFVQSGEPSPSNEVPIQNVTGDVEVKVENIKINTIEIKAGLYKIENGEYEGNSSYVCSNDFLEVTGGKRIFVTSSEKKKGTYFVLEYNQNKTFIGYKRSNANITEYEITLRNDTKYVLLDLGNGSEPCNPSNTGNFETKLYLEEQTVTFPLEEGQILHKEDTIENKIVQKRTTDVIDENTTIVLTGTENERRFWIGLKNRVKAWESAPRSNYFNTNNTNTMFIQTSNDNNGVWIFDKQRYFETLADFKNWVKEKKEAGNPLKIEYRVATPIEIPFTETQRVAKEQIDKLYSYKGTTYISSTNDPSPTFKIQYVKEE